MSVITMRGGSVTGASVFPHVPLLDQIEVSDLKRVCLSLLVLGVTLWASRVLGRRFRWTLERGGFQINIAILLARVLWMTLWTVAILLVLSVNGIALTPLAALIGVIGLAASLSLQQVLQNLVAGIYLLAERPFRIGDIISVVGVTAGAHEGRVEDIQMRTTHLRSAEDELILVPNSTIFSGVVTNHTEVGGYAAQLTLTWPREIDPATVVERVIPVLRGVPAVRSTPPPELRVDMAGKEEWRARLLFWTDAESARPEAICAIARAYPDILVNEGAEAP